MSSNVQSLDTHFLRRMSIDGFHRIGWFSIKEGRTLDYGLDLQGAEGWRYSVYAYVSYVDGGMVMRIGKCEGELNVRLRGYKRDIECALGGTLGLNEYFKGGTQPWEPPGWLAFTVPFSGGLIFAQQINAQPTEMESKRVLRATERTLIRDYNPPLCGVSEAGRRRRAEWQAEHGKPIARSKRG